MEPGRRLLLYLASVLADGWLGVSIAACLTAPEPADKPPRRVIRQSVPGCGSGVDGPYRPPPITNHQSPEKALSAGPCRRRGSD